MNNKNGHLKYFKDCNSIKLFLNVIYIYSEHILEGAYHMK